MTQQLQEFIYASEDFKEKSEKLAQSIEINSVLLSVNIILLGSHQFPAWEPPRSFCLESHPRHKM